MHPSQSCPHVLPTPRIVSYTARSVRGAEISKNTKAAICRNLSSLCAKATKSRTITSKQCDSSMNAPSASALVVPWKEASSPSQSAPRVPDFQDCRRNSGVSSRMGSYRASARDLAAGGGRSRSWRWSIQACPHGRGGRPILPTPVVAAIKGLPDTFWPFPPRK